MVGLASAATTQYSVLPADTLESGDLYIFEATTSASGNSPSRAYTLATKSGGGPVALTFPAPWIYAGPPPAAQPTFTFNYTGTSGTANGYQSTMYSWPMGSSGTDAIDVTATLNYQAGSTTLTVPNLSSVAGFLPAPPSGAQVTWFAQVWQSSYGFNWPPPGNSTYSSVSNEGSFTVP